MDAGFSATELVDIAKQIERCGEAFYGRAAARVAHPGVRDLFERLRVEELAHAREFEGLLGRLQAGPADWRQEDEYVAYMRTLANNRVFPSTEAVDAAVAGIKDEREAVALAIRFEQETILFLHGLSRMARPEDRPTLEEMVKEEESHVVRLTEIDNALGSGS